MRSIHKIIVTTIVLAGAAIACAIFVFTPQRSLAVTGCTSIIVQSNTPTNWLIGGPQTDGKFINSPSYPALVMQGTATKDSSGIALPAGAYSIQIPATASTGATPKINGTFSTTASLTCRSGQSITFTIVYALPVGSGNSGSSGSSAFTLIKLGSRNVLVAIAQRLLVQEGYLRSAVTGTFDAGTQTAVNAFQKAKGLAVTGTLSIDMKALSSVVSSFVTIQAGSPTVQIMDIQKFLIGRNYLKVRTPSGSFDAATVAAVKAFQKAYNVPQTGVVDLATFQAMNRE